MASSLQSILNQVLGESGFLVPSSYVGSGSPDDEQLVYLANAASDRLREDGLQEIRRTGTINITSATSYTLPSDFLGYVSDTAYIQGRLDPVIVPTTATEWQQVLASGSSAGLFYRVRFLRGALDVLDPQDGDVLQFEYVSNAPWTSADSSTPKERATADSDLCLFDFRAMVLATKWLWKKEKGLPDWQVDQAAYVEHRNLMRARNAGARTLYEGGPSPTYDPVPQTNLWIRP